VLESLFKPCIANPFSHSHTASGGLSAGRCHLETKLHVFMLNSLMVCARCHLILDMADTKTESIQNSGCGTCTGKFQMAAFILFLRGTVQKCLLL